jgi:hypothetical protein
VRLLPLLLLATALTSSLSAQTVRVPRRAVPLHGPVDVDELLRLARISQTINAKTYLQYSFRQTTRLEDLTEASEVKRTETKVYRVIPSRQGTIRHLLEQDGEPPSRRQVKKQLARNEKVRKRWEKIRARQEKTHARKRAQQAKRRGDAPAATRQATEPGPAAARTTPRAPAAAGTAAPGKAPATRGQSPPNAAQQQEEAAPVVTRTVIAPRGLLSEPEADLPPLPTCDVDAPASALRAPWKGSQTRSRRGIRRSSEQARKARSSTGDYTIFELLSLTNYEYLGACIYEERPVHVVAFVPADDFDAQNPVERVVTAMEGTIFIDASDIQVMRTEAETVGPIKWGAGMVALRSAHVVFEGRKVNDEVWLPAADVFEFDSRVLFDKDRQRFTNYYDDYKKIVVGSSEEFIGVNEPGAPGDG